MEDFILFEEVEKTDSGNKHGYQIWNYSVENRKLEFIQYIGTLMYDYWIDYYSDLGHTVILKSLEPEKKLENAPEFYGDKVYSPIDTEA